MKFRYNSFLLGWKAFFYVKCADVIHRFVFVCFSWRIKPSSHESPKRILLANYGSLGDVVMCLGIVAEIRRQIPGCKIGFIVSKRARAALESFPSLDWVHEGEFWVKPNQTVLQYLASLFKFLFFEQAKLVEEIRAIDYDCAIELRPFFPNMIPVFWKSKIPLRIGFLSSFNTKLLNAPVSWSKDQYLSHSYWDLLKKIGITKQGPQPLSPAMTLDKNSFSPSLGPYLIFHLCSSNPVKEFSSEFWRSLYQKCREDGYEIYFTGRGDRDAQIIRQVVDEERYNLCNKLKWTEYVGCILQSRGVVSVDSVSVHIAAAFGIPCAVLFRNTPLLNLWKPNRETCSAFGIAAPVQIKDVMNLIGKWK